MWFTCLQHRESYYLIKLRRIGLAGTWRELRWIVGSRCVRSHVRHPSGGVGGWRGASLLWTGGVLQRLVRIPRHSSRAVLLPWKTLRRKTSMFKIQLCFLGLKKSSNFPKRMWWKELKSEENVSLTSEWKGRLRPCCAPEKLPCWGILWGCAGWEGYKPPVEGGSPGLRGTIPPWFIPGGPRGPEWDRNWLL